MKLRHSMVMVAALMTLIALVACQGERATITGEYGASVVAGRVTVTGMANNSPAGVQVSVRGTGLATTLTADGGFTFAGVPRDVDLVFRRGDGINASLAVGASSGFIDVTVSAGSATKSSKRRSASGGEKTYELEGVVVSASATELVMFTSHQEEIAIVLDAQTIVRKGQQTVAPADLLAGARVHVKARKANDVYTAIVVIVQNTDTGDGSDDEGEHERKEYEGVVRSASATELVIFDSHQDEVTFALTADTVIRKGNTTLAATDIENGDRVHVKATTGAGGTKTATEVKVQSSKN